MAFDSSGNWKPEDDSTSGKLNGLLKTDSPLMEQAKTAGLATANARGLLNSSIAVGAAQDSAIKAATPIAMADAEAVRAKNLSGMQIKSSADIQAADTAAQASRQATQITANREAQVLDNDAQSARLASTIASQDRQQETQVASQQKIAGMQVASNDRERAAAITATTQQTYASMFNAILDNKDIPAATREQYLDHIARTADSNMALVEQIYGIDLQWNSGGGSATGTTGLGPAASPTGAAQPVATPPAAPPAAAEPRAPGLLGPGSVATDPELEASIAERIAQAGSGFRAYGNRQ